MSVYPTLQKAMNLAGLLALLANLSNFVKKGDMSTLDMTTLGIFLFQHIVSFIVNMNYTSQINPDVWVSACMTSIVACNVILFLMFIKLEGYGHCHKVRECSEGANNSIKLPGQKELLYLAAAIALQLGAFRLKMAFGA